MFKIKYGDVLHALVEGLLPRGSGDKALYVKLALRVADNVNVVMSKHRYVHVVCTRRSNYVGTFVGTSEIFYDKPELTNTSYHDSCWREDGFRCIDELYFDLCKLVNPNKAPRDLDGYNIIEMIQILEPVTPEKFESPDGYGPRFKPLNLAKILGEETYSPERRLLY